jgi:phage FluMu protein Com
MANNPLKKYFRQPKVYINLPSGGIYNQPGTLAGDPTNIPVFGMTGMDEIMLKTPDALLSGESTVKVIESCCSTIKDAWDLSLLDLDIILTAIRIATFGNSMSVTHTCPHCKSINDYDIELGTVVEHFTKCQYDNKIVLKDISVSIRPLNYRQWTDFQLKNFGVQKQLQQAINLTDEEEQSKLVNALFEHISKLQTEVMMMQIDSVQTQEANVNQREFIEEWLTNSESTVFEAIKNRIDKNRLAWEMPKFNVTCDSCSAENQIQVNLDQSNFFVSA